ncbi:TetR/AcrR family transcriptional regulator [Kutzneria albida]|uniref:TetR/AcrR family transcriptional regulator n=1 Tax=Kutzneria albida TaxID=43357 RepID=UPI00046D1BA4|nr:TetR/AcrR family transcriptional regulator [Kutzneria albida]
MPTSTSRSSGPAERKGRPRSVEKDQAILAAALDLLAKEGFTRMTLDGVAAAAGVSKATIHLRWRTKADLVTAALESMRLNTTVHQVGEVRADLVAHLEEFRLTLERVNGMPMIGTCLAEEAHTPELLDLLRERTVRPRRALFREVLAQARERGELAADVDLDAATSALIGSYYADRLAGRVTDARWTERVVDQVLNGLRQR